LAPSPIFHRRAVTTKNQLLLALLKKLREKKNSIAKGFTLVEQMIMGGGDQHNLGSGPAQYLGARNAAAASSAISNCSARPSHGMRYLQGNWQRMGRPLSHKWCGRRK